MTLHIDKIEKTIYHFALAHRDLLVEKRFSPYITGVAGIGKTEIIKKLGTDLDMAVIITHVAQLEPSDLVGIPRSHKIDDNTFVQKYDLPSYLPFAKKNTDGSYVFEKDKDGFERPVFLLELLGSKIKNRHSLKEKHGVNWMNEVKGVILFFDEINRATSDETKQAIFELPGDYSLHEYEVPPGCIIVAAGNPPNADYELNSMDEDVAWMDRFVHLDASTNTETVLKHFSKNNVHPSVLKFINNNENALLKPTRPYEIKTERSPRSYERLSNILTNVPLPNDKEIFTEIAIGCLGKEFGTSFSRFYFEKGDDLVSLENITKDYPNHKAYFSDLIENNKNSVLNAVLSGIHLELLNEKNFKKLFFNDNYENENPVAFKNFTDFLSDLDSENRSVFIKKSNRIEHFLKHFLAQNDEVFNLTKNDFNSIKK